MSSCDAPDASLYLPARHGTQDEIDTAAEALEYLPATHGAHVLAVEDPAVGE